MATEPHASAVTHVTFYTVALVAKHGPPTVANPLLFLVVFPGAHSGSVCRHVCRSGVYTELFIMGVVGAVPLGETVLPTLVPFMRCWVERFEGDKESCAS